MLSRSRRGEKKKKRFAPGTFEKSSKYASLLKKKKGKSYLDPSQTLGRMNLFARLLRFTQPLRFLRHPLRQFLEGTAFSLQATDKKQLGKVSIT